MPLHESIDAEDAVNFLNELVKLDSEAISALIQSRVPCNEKMENHWSVQVTGADGGPSLLGFLGVINGLFGTIDFGSREGYGPITAVFSDDGHIVNFELTKSE